MVWNLLRQSLRTRLIRSLLLLFLVWEFFETFTIERAISRNAIIEQHSSQLRSGKIFIVSLPWNNEIILRTHWNAQLVDLVKTLGPDNVYVSIYENGSYDHTKDALTLLAEQLDAAGIRSHIVREDKSHADMMTDDGQTEGWVLTPQGRKELRRIPYLSQLRNIAMKPLVDLAAKGEHFDKVMFLNDVVFQVPPTSSFSHEYERLIRYTDSRCPGTPCYEGRKLRKCLRARLRVASQILRHFRSPGLRGPSASYANVALLQVTRIAS